MKCPRCHKEFFGTPDRCPHCRAKFVWVSQDEYDRRIAENTKPVAVLSPKPVEEASAPKPVEPIAAPEMTLEEKASVFVKQHRSLFLSDLGLRFFATFFALAAFLLLALLPAVRISPTYAVDDFNLLGTEAIPVLGYAFTLLARLMSTLPNQELWSEVLRYSYYAVLAVPALGLVIVLLCRFFRYVVPSLRNSYFKKNALRAMKDSGPYRASRHLGFNIFLVVFSCLLTPVLFSLCFYLLPKYVADPFAILDGWPRLYWDVVYLSVILGVLCLEPILTIISRATRRSIGKLDLGA